MGERRYHLKRKDKPHYGVMAEAIRSVVLKRDPMTVLDVGCSIGELLRHLDSPHTQSCGVDGSAFAIENFRADAADRHVVDLESFDGRIDDTFYELVTCLEVAEHVANWKGLLSFIDANASSKATLVFSAAPPGQPGRGHINCRSPQWWQARLDAVGKWTFDAVATDEYLAAIRDGVPTCYMNSRVYRRGQ